MMLGVLAAAIRRANSGEPPDVGDRPVFLATKEVSSASAIEPPNGWEPGQLAVLALTSSVAINTSSLPGWTVGASRVVHSMYAYVFYRVLQSGDTGIVIPEGGIRTGQVSTFAAGTFNEVMPIEIIGSNQAPAGTSGTTTLAGVGAGRQVDIGQHLMLHICHTRGQNTAASPYPYSQINYTTEVYAGPGVYYYTLASAGEFNGNLSEASVYGLVNSPAWTATKFVIRGRVPTPPDLPGVGEYWASQGGWYAGREAYNNNDYHLVLADKAADVTGLKWKTSVSTSAANDSFDGMKNTQAQVTAGLGLHPAAAHCVDYRGGGFTDWYMPGQNELKKTTLGVLGAGQLASGMPQANEPAQYYWGAYEYESDTAVSDRGDGSARFYAGKTSTDRRVRPVRRVRASPAAGLPYINTIGAALQSKAVPQVASPRGVDISPDGLKMIVVGFNENRVQNYALTTPYLMGDNTKIVSSWLADTVLLSARFYADGTKAIVTTNSPWGIRRYSLAEPWSFGTNPTLEATVTELPGMVAGSGAVFITRDGMKLYRYAASGKIIEQYNLSAPGAIETATLAYAEDFGGTITNAAVSGFLLSDDGLGLWIASGSFADNTGGLDMYALTSPGDVRAAAGRVGMGHRPPAAWTYLAGHPMAWSPQVGKLIIASQKDSVIREYMPTVS